MHIYVLYVPIHISNALVLKLHPIQDNAVINITYLYNLCDDLDHSIFAPHRKLLERAGKVQQISIIFVHRIYPLAKVNIKYFNNNKTAYCI